MSDSPEKVYIGSLNPAKIECVRLAFTRVFTSRRFDFIGRSVSSGVAEQPYGDGETYQGAMNRAVQLRKENPMGDFWVGIEGGIEQINRHMHAFAWMVILDSSRHGEARTATFILPEKIAALINKGVELGHADDMVFKRKNSKQKDGAVGILTNGLIDRTAYYESAIVLALIPFIKTDLFLSIEACVEDR